MPGDVNAKDHFGRTALMHAALGKNLEDVQILLQTPGVECDATDQKGQTALHFAADIGYNDESRCTEIVLALLRAGANVNHKTIYGTTPLHLAASSNAKRITEVLLEKGAITNSIDGIRRTPLHYAASRDAVDAVAVLLLRKDVIVPIRNDDHESVRELAIHRGATRVIPLLDFLTDKIIEENRPQWQAECTKRPDPEDRRYGQVVGWDQDGHPIFQPLPFLPEQTWETWERPLAEDGTVILPPGFFPEVTEDLSSSNPSSPIGSDDSSDFSDSTGTEDIGEGIDQWVDREAYMAELAQRGIYPPPPPEVFSGDAEDVPNQPLAEIPAVADGSINLGQDDVDMGSPSETD